MCEPDVPTNLESTPALLLVTDDTFLQRGVGRLLSTRQPVHVASSTEQARRAFASRAVWGGLVVDADLGAGCALEFLAWARSSRASVPAAVLSYREAWDLKRRVDELGAAFVDKLFVPETLVPFVGRMPAWRAHVDPVDLAVESLVWRTSLTPREASIVAHAVAGASREAIAEALGISVNTVKTHVRSLLRKVGMLSLDEVALSIFRNARTDHAPRSQ